MTARATRYSVVDCFATSTSDLSLVGPWTIEVIVRVSTSPTPT